MSLILSGSDGLSDVDGSASTPAIRGTDANTGIFFPAADTIAFAEGGVESMRLDSSGNVGIGTSSPASRLSVTGNGNIGTFDGGAVTSVTLTGSTRSDVFLVDSGAATDQKRLTIRGDGGNLIFGVENDAITAFTERMRIDSSGRVTTPFQPCVFAVKNNGTGWTSYGGTFIFNNAPLNVGNHYNASTGVFTCPVAGVYEVYAMILGGNSGGNGTVSVRRNGVDYNFPGGHYNSNGTSLWFAVPQFTYINCAANDQLTIYVTASAGSLFDTNSYPQMAIRLVQ